MLDRAEQLLHERFGDEEYWAARRSMRFSRRLVEEAEVYRGAVLASSDAADGTLMKDDWRDQRVGIAGCRNVH